MIKTKSEMLGALSNILNNFVFGMVLSRITPEGGWQKLAAKKATFEGPEGTFLHVDLAPLVVNLANPPDRRLLLEEFENVLKRALLSEAHEVILAYCEATNQFSIYKAEPWFQFARIIRNVASHKDGGILHDWPAALRKGGTTTVAWRGRTLEPAMLGKPVEFTHHEALQLFNDQRDFATTKLT